MITPRDTRRFQVVGRPFLLAVAGLLTVGTLGCQPTLDPQEYGEVISVLPHVPGAEKPYPLPKPAESSDTGDDSPSSNAK
jgi:hypothetical protein